jgi:hypothetical protein
VYTECSRARNAESHASFQQLAALIGNHSQIDVPCPLCSPYRKPANRKKPVLRIWCKEPGFITFCCAHCEAHGCAHDDGNPFVRRPDPRLLAQRMREAEQARLERDHKQRRTAQWLWAHSQPIEGTLADKFLTTARGIMCTRPETLRFLPANDGYPPAMIAAFGIPSEPVPGQLDVARMMVHAVHLTQLMPDGSGREAKKFIASPRGMPIVVAPVNDLGGLGITEGIEDGLSLHEATGLGAWAAGSANRLPELALAIPHYVESVTILVDDNDDGRRNSLELARRITKIRGRRFDVRLLESCLLLARAAA